MTRPTTGALPAPVAERLERLAPDQRAAATSPPGPILCVAPAGSGKTTTLVARIAWRIATGTDPARICALTFNKRAAEELDARLGEALAPLGIEGGTVRVRTFHALGREILADAGVDVSRLMDRAALLAELYGHPLPPALLRRLDDAFSRFTLDPGAAPPPDSTEADAQVRSAYARYRAALRERTALDFDDLVARALALLREDPALRSRWRDRCSTLMVDEAQDLDRSQLDLALILCEPARDVFLVGDDDQTIYAWRLADVRRILGLASALPGLRRVDLETNYRCPAEVVARAVRLIEHGQERFAKRIRAGPKAAGRLVLAADPGDALARARRLLSAWYGRDEGGHAVLARTNAELAPYAAVALEQGIAFAAAQTGLLLDSPSLPAVMRRLRDLGADRVMQLDELDRALGTDGGLAESLRRTVLGWAAPHGTYGALAAAIEQSVERLRELHRPDAALVLATMHTTKGLEFDHVAVVGLDEGAFPSERSLTESADPGRALEEERRLAYVAWTRARRSLLLLFDPAVPSIFLREAFDDAELAA
ncbi:MAG: ATP-dependent helicase UvrD/PcrA [Chloroflexota bacterium]|jgi:superfamily I DNA/RNA helicase|nr:ATP-dependent helicase UvrD/PcrA [Chloroflexota bacterium]